MCVTRRYIDGGSVLDMTKYNVLQEKHIATITREILLGLSYLRDVGKIHRDIKCANVLLSTSGAVKLADFGASRQLTDTMAKCNTVVGSPYWMVSVRVQVVYCHALDQVAVFLCRLQRCSSRMTMMARPTSGRWASHVLKWPPVDLRTPSEILCR